jgi:hypothetical protein
MKDEAQAQPAADPMAKARAAKARKAAEQAEREAEQAEVAAAPVADAQPVVSSLKTKAEAQYQGELVEVVVTHWGHGQISTGGEHGFERYARGARIALPEFSARSLFNKRWVEPVEPSLADRWVAMNNREVRQAIAAKRNTEFRMDHGVAPGEEWRSAMSAGELSFSPRDEEFRGV